LRSSSVKTAASLATCTNEELRFVICFLSGEGVKPIEIHRQMKGQYGDARLSLQQVYEWTRKFMNSTSSVIDSPQPGQAHNKLQDKKYLRFSFDPPMYKYPYTYYTSLS
jgi:hypothetical protein